jgi:hypothetical protein
MKGSRIFRIVYKPAPPKFFAVTGKTQAPKLGGRLPFHVSRLPFHD